jgi:soluble lytic murein transglycosylase-like protein
MLCACTNQAFVRSHNTTVYIPTVVNATLSWHAPAYADTLFGIRLFRDGPPVKYPALAITRAILRTNPRLSPIDALRLAGATVNAARAHDLPPEFLGATLLQESAYDPRALSAAGAVGIAQFMPSTANGIGVDPFEPFSAIDGAATLLASYVRTYDGVYANPYAAALAAYNAGPGAVSAYHGVPPYPETREYIADIVDRWAKIVGYEPQILRR